MIRSQVLGRLLPLCAQTVERVSVASSSGGLSVFRALSSAALQPQVEADRPNRGAPWGVFLSKFASGYSALTQKPLESITKAETVKFRDSEEGLERISQDFFITGTCFRECQSFQQRYGISTSSYRGDAEEPVRSPLSQAPGPLQDTTGRKLAVSESKTAQAVLTGIRMSPQKLNMMAEMVRGMRVEDALNQMAVSVKRAAKTVTKVVHSAQANAVHNYGFNKDLLVVAEAFVGKDKFLKRFKPHGKGKAGKMERARSRLTVILKEMSKEAEADLARLRLFRKAGTRMSRSEARLVPHRLLETQWNRKRTPPEPSPTVG